VNVCILTETYHPITGGGETQARVLAQGFAARGSIVNVLTRRLDTTLPRSEMLGGATVWRLAPTGPGHLKKWGLVVSVFLRLFRLRRSYDVILVAGYRVMGIPSVVVAWVLGKPCILKADSLGEFSGEFFNPGLKRFHLGHDQFPVNVALMLRNCLLRRADAFIAISSAVSEELQENGVQADKIFEIPNSVDTTKFCPVAAVEKRKLRDTLGIPHDKYVGVYTGRLVSTKGLPLLALAWKNIIHSYPDAMLVFVGTGGVGIQNCEDYLRNFVSDNSLEANVMFTGSVSSVHEYLQASDFFVFPTEREAFGISVIEAMACALPVITTATGGTVDIVAHQENAIVISVDDGLALESALKKMLRRDCAIDLLAKNGRRVAVERYSEPQILQRYEALFAELSPVGSNE